MSFAAHHPGGIPYHREEFTADERAVLSRFFTELDGPVFALVNLPEVVKGALFARYSRSPKSIRRLFLDEFHARPEIGIGAIAAVPEAGGEVTGMQRAEELYRRVFSEYGDDSVAQLGGAHLACEQASNILTKVLEWGRLAAYLEQSTRYIFYDQRLGDRYRYVVPPEVAASPHAAAYTETMEWLFDTYSLLLGRMVPYYEVLYPRQEGDSAFVWRSTIRAKACDDLRGLLPAATQSNVGIFADGQAYEGLLLRMRAHPLAEVRHYADLMLTELRKVIPAFLRRVDIPDRGGDWSRYLEETARVIAGEAAALDAAPEPRPPVRLVEWDPDAETKAAAAALYAVSDLPDDQLLDIVTGMPADERARLLRGYVGDRRNRRHKPGRALERAFYRFDLLTDYGIFRDLQRHRMLTMEWQRLSPLHGYVTPPAVPDIDAAGLWDEAMERTAALHHALETDLGTEVAQYAVPFAYRIRYYFHVNARELFHLLELRTAPGGHPDYRAVCQEMHRQVRDVAGHHLLADAMQFVDHSTHELARLEGERRAAARRAAAGITDPD
jgi:thymidylate synthase ThyX